MNELELCKAISDIEGWKGNFNSGALEQVVVGGDGCVGKALLFDLILKYKVEVSWCTRDTTIFGDACAIAEVGFEDDAGIPRAILECIVEANQ